MSDEVQTSRPAKLRLLPVPGFTALARTRGWGVAPVRGRLPDTLRPPKTRTAGFGALLLTFLLFVGVPVAAAGAYYGWLASDIYVSEAKFAVRGAVEHLPSSSAMASSPVAALTTVNSNQDAYIVAGYIDSLTLVEKIQGQRDLREVFGRPEIDRVARLKADASIEDIHLHWRQMVRTTIDHMSGIVTLQVKAHSREDALDLSRRVLAESERLVNEMSRRKNTDAVRFASEEVSRAEQRLQAARLAMQDFRNTSGLLDPVKQAESTLRLGMLLRSERIALENEILAARRTLSENAPSVQVLSARLAGIKDQIGNLEQSLTGSGQSEAKSAATALFRFEGLELERIFSEKLYAMAQAIYEKIRINADRQGLYLTTFVPPALAEQALFPERGKDVLVILFCAFAIWSVFSLIVASVRDHNL